MQKSANVYYVICKSNKITIVNCLSDVKYLNENEYLNLITYNYYEHLYIYLILECILLMFM